MRLTPLGAQVLTMGETERHEHAKKLLKGTPIKNYTPGICYDAAAYVRALIGTGIDADDVPTVSGQAWVKKLGFNLTKPWDGTKALKPGQAVGFYRLIDKKFFHAAIATGSAKIRAVNGHLLGNGWVDEVDLKHVLGKPDEHKQFDYDNTKIQVFLSKL